MSLGVSETSGRDADLWVFGYGSLMWKPGFPFEERFRARLARYHRAFCVTSTHHRGSHARPGLVLGLDLGGSCDGIAYRVAAREAPAVRRYLTEREQVYGVYRAARLPVVLTDAPAEPTVVQALAYVVERAHPSYTGPLPLAEQARRIRAARGISGCNLDYLANTLDAFAALGIRERDLERVGVLARIAFAGCGGPDVAARPAVRALQACAARVTRPPPSLPVSQRRRFVHRRTTALR